ncbi:bacteriohemerythrin [Desulfoluna spongiiphila]|uniref:Hemerythrin n=1 Tax=Desulfoluna spongiiphila TaxID=419481 RepID=A0A1G5ATF5_9BACT|nr:hemerythrin family protein [Desulfoluna spongiiphila]SCX81144.1 hemerythrin [Desulfoluna spongiiphila]VVS91998.1 haemerythrin-like [Desulfoluna spongiiphila]
MTEPLVWTEAISVNIPEIDEQHQALFAIINDIIKVHEEQGGPGEILMRIGQLMDYSDRHFLTEEKLMIRHKFPRFVEHNKAHMAYMEQVDLFISDYKTNKQGLIHDMLEFLTHWWREHVSRSDPAYARHIHSD